MAYYNSPFQGLKVLHIWHLDYKKPGDTGEGHGDDRHRTPPDSPEYAQPM